jgi:hypothetical protein
MPLSCLRREIWKYWLKIDVKTIYSYVQCGLIPYVKIQSNVRFSKFEILNWIEDHSRRPRLTGASGSTRR